MFAPEPRGRDLAPDRCVVWTTTWSGTDDAGRRLTGRYQFVARPYGSDSRGSLTRIQATTDPNAVEAR